MIQAQFRKGKITRWLLPVVLVLSLFTFSGVGSLTTADSYRAATEQIDPLRLTGRKIASVRFFNRADSFSVIPDQSKSYRQLTLDYSRAVEIQFDRCEGQCLTFNQLDRLLLRSLPNSDEDY